MTKKPETLVEDIFDLLKAGREGKAPSFSDADWDRIGKNYAEALKRVLRTEVKQRKPKTIYISELGTPCMRKMWYRQRPEMFVSEALNGAALLKFFYGDLIEETVLSLAELAGHKVEKRQHAVKLELKDGWCVSGRIDAVIDGLLVDVKSCSPMSYQKFEDISKLMENDPFGYLMQLSTYHNHVDREDDKHAAFLAIEKVLGKMTLERIEYHDRKGEVDLVPILNDLVDILESPTEPAHPESLAPVPATKKKDKLCTTCAYCEYKEHCWRESHDGLGLKTEIMSNGPRFIVKGGYDDAAEDSK